MNQINGWIGRRDTLRWLVAGSSAILATSVFGYPQEAQAAIASASFLTPDDALARLMDGNYRFRHRPRHPHQSPGRLHDVAQAQHPFATILSCADSRVAAELVFDQGLGDLFDVRVAGNIVTPEVVGSLEYAAVLLGTPLVMIMGHARCGAVTAAVNGEALPGAMGTFVKQIQPALNQVKNQQGDPVDNAVIANIRYQTAQLQQMSPLLVQQVESGNLKIVGGRYDLDTGTVAIVS